jgi:hypothetical protein
MALPAQDPASWLLNLARERLWVQWEPIARRLDTLDDWQRRLAQWLIAAETYAILEEKLDERIDGLHLLAFGVSAAEVYYDPTPQITAYVLPAALESSMEQVVPLEVPGEATPEPIDMTVEAWDVALHAPLNLTYATLACWAKPTSGSHGLLTVRHAAPNGRVHLDDGTVEKVLWYAPNCLDAVVAGAPARALTALGVAVATAGDSVDVIVKGGPKQRVVKDVGQTFGTITAAIPHVLILDKPLQPGDSGSLVRLDGGGDALGIYIGSLPTPSGARGLCQGLDQLDRLYTTSGRSGGFYLE